MLFFGSFLLFFFFLRLWLSTFGGIHPDEAYYWVWSQHLDWGYFDHPPFIAWLIRASQAIVNPFIPGKALQEFPLFFAQFQLRALPYFVSCVVLPMLLARSIEITQKRPLGLLQMGVLLSSPIFVFGPQIVTPDLPFFTAWAACLYFNLRLLEARGDTAVPGDSTPFRLRLSIEAGILLSICAYSKYSAILAALLFVVCGTGPYNSLVAGITSLLLTLPHFLWYQKTGLSEGAGIFFQLNRALSDFPKTNFRFMGDLIASQLFLWSPLVFWYSLQLPLQDLKVFFLPRKFRRPSGTLFLWAFVPVLFFSLTALQRRAEANWPLVGVIGALVLVLSRSYDRPQRLFSTLFSNFFINSLVVVVLFAPLHLADVLRPFLPHLSQQLEKPSRVRDFSGWDRFHTLVYEATRGNDFPIQVESYQLLSELLFFDQVIPNESLSSRLRVWEEGSRKSQFNLWPQYHMDPVMRAYWIVVHSNRGYPNHCRVSQTLYRHFEDEVGFHVLRCGF